MFEDKLTKAIKLAENEKHEKAIKLCNKILKNESDIDIEIFNPMPAPIDKIQNKYRWRIIAKGKLSNKLLDTINSALEEFYGLKYKNISISADINPMNMM